MKPVSDEIRAWLNKASSDLLAAQILVEHSALALGPAAFHCQQTAEKVLKAFLIFKAVPFDRVHNLVYLLDLCETAEPDFAALRKSAESLTPYAVEIRYPGDSLEISPKEAHQALAAAETIWHKVLSFMPRELHPSLPQNSDEPRSQTF
jgi:HEPN domain-containing protein